MTSQGTSPTPLRALVVDDHPTNRLVLTGILTRLGIEVVEAVDGASALEAVTSAEAGAFDFVLMDLNMPVLDGFDAAKGIREHERTMGRPRLPIVPITAWVTEEAKARAAASGMDGFLAKPVTVAAVRDLIEGTLFAKAAEDDAGAGDSPVVDLRHLRDIGGEELVAGALSAFFDHSEKLMQRLRVVETKTPDRAPEVAEIAHALKGSSLTIGADDLARSAAELEVLARAGDLSALVELKARIERGLQDVRAATERYQA